MSEIDPTMLVGEALHQGLVIRTLAKTVCGELSPESRRDGLSGPIVLCELEPGHVGSFHQGRPGQTVVVWVRTEDDPGDIAVQERATMFHKARLLPPPPKPPKLWLRPRPASWKGDNNG